MDMVSREPAVPTPPPSAYSRAHRRPGPVYFGKCLFYTGTHMCTHTSPHHHQVNSQMQYEMHLLAKGLQDSDLLAYVAECCFHVSLGTFHSSFLPSNGSRSNFSLLPSRDRCLETEPFENQSFDSHGHPHHPCQSLRTYSGAGRHPCPSGPIWQGKVLSSSPYPRSSPYAPLLRGSPKCSKASNEL